MPYILEWLVNPVAVGWHGFAYTAAVVLSGILGAQPQKFLSSIYQLLIFLFVAALSAYHATFLAWGVAARVRATLIIMTYKKALKLQGIGKDAGKIVNMVAVDAQYALTAAS